MNKILDRIKSFLSEHAFWSEVITALVMIIVFSVVVARMANRRTAELREESNKLTAIRTGVERWQSGFQTVTPEENAEWAVIQDSLQMLGVTNADRLTLAQLVAQRAQDAGAGHVIVRFTTSDTPGSVTRGVGNWSYKSATYGLTMDLGGDIEAALQAIYSLPLSVEVNSVKITRSGDNGEVTTNVSLTVYEPA